MNKFKCISLIFALLISTSGWSQGINEKNIPLEVERASKRPICITTTFEDSSKIIKNPGNCPVEILRRIGRAIAKNWPDGKIPSKTGSIMFNEFVGTQNFIKAFPEDKLSETQQKACNDLMVRYTNKFSELISDFSPASEAITIKVALDIPEIQKNFKNLIETEDKKQTPVSEQEISKIKNSILPVVEAFKDCCGVFSLSENGIFVRADTEIETDKIKEILPQRNLTIGNYIDEEPLIILAQTHGIEDSESAMQKLDNLPNMSVIKQMIASAGIDFKKDIIENYASESVLYVNLTPTGEKLIPDIRWITLVPTIERLRAILPKLQNLCMQLGVFVATEEDSNSKISLVKLNYFMFKDYSLYAAIQDNFCIFASTKEGAFSTINQLKNVSKANTNNKLNECNLYFRVRTSDLNTQLQQFLQSPLIRDKGIPPVTNLTFLNDMNNITVFAKLIDNKLKFTVDIPFIKKEKKE